MKDTFIALSKTILRGKDTIMVDGESNYGYPFVSRIEVPYSEIYKQEKHIQVNKLKSDEADEYRNAETMTYISNRIKI